MVIAANPASGRGRAMALADEAARELAAAGHEVRRVNTERTDSALWLDGPLDGANALLVVGGDGTVRACAPRAAAAGVPIRQLPAGTENLFSRQFRQVGGVAGVIAALARPQLQRCDLWQANGEAFLLMCSAGFDAEVVAKVARVRGRSISRLVYFKPLVQSALSWRAPHWTVEIDSQSEIAFGRGTLLGVNCPAYACGWDPIRGAAPGDGLLDVALLRCTTGIGAMGWVMRLTCGAPQLSVVRCVRLTVRASTAFRVQIDGDPLGDGPVEQLEITKNMVPLLVLTDPVC